MTAPSTDARPLDVLATGVRWSRWLVILTVLISLVAMRLPVPAQQGLTLALVAAGLLAGLPHGSIDHRLAAELTGWSTPVVTIGYAGMAVLTWVLLMVAGPVALVLVIALSMAHFGLGELEITRQHTGWRPSPPVGLAVAVAGTGALILPLARSGRQWEEVAVSISPQLGSLLGDTTVRFALAGFWIVAATVAAAAAVRARQLGVAGDIVLLGVLGATAPPLVAFAVWFGGWHALRHSARLMTVDGRSAALVTQGQPRRALAALARMAAWPSLAAVLVLAGLVVATLTAADPIAAVGVTLLVLLSLTVPHMVVVLLLDHAPDRAAD